MELDFYRIPSLIDNVIFHNVLKLGHKVMVSECYIVEVGSCTLKPTIE